MHNIAALLEFPCSALLSACFLLTVFAVWKYAGNQKAVILLSRKSTARVLLALGAVMLALEGTFSWPVHTSAVFAVYMLFTMLSLALVTLDAIRQKRRIGFILNHLGIFLILWAGMFGSADVTKCRMVVPVGTSSDIAYTQERLAIPLPFSVALDDFSIDHYPDGHSPKQFTSSLYVDGKHMQTSVNHPCSYRGYTIYQQGYDTVAGRYTVLELIRDPWLPIVYAGMGLLAIGSIMLLFGKWKAKVTVPITLVLTVLFTVLTVAKINFGTLMPALRSWWFVPHLFLYMVAYSLMAMAVVAGLWVLVSSFKIKVSSGSSQSSGASVAALCSNLMRSSSALLIIGMLIGSIWAKEAWGDYWAWDPKENWAAATWLLSLMFLHMGNKSTHKALSVMLLAFLALQITWYGVNYLPSAANSLHSYYTATP